MAGVAGRSGGDRPEAPQNNPMNVSATGGAGQSGTQAPKYIPGMNQLGSSGVETMAQQGGAAMYAAPTTPQMPPVTGLTAETANPQQDIMDGAPMGPGATSVQGLPVNPTNDPDIELMREYYPILNWWASQPGAAQGTKDYVRYLGTII